MLISLNGETIPNNNKSRISVYDFDAIDQDDDISSSALRCQSELSTSDVKDTTNGCLVGAGDSLQSLVNILHKIALPLVVLV